MIWQDYKKLYANALKQYSPKFKKELQNQVNTYCRTLDYNAISDKAIKKTIQKLHLAMGVKMAQISSKVVKRSVKGIYEALEVKSAETDLFAYTILQYLQTQGLDQLASDITNTTKEQIRRYLVQSAEQNLTLPESIVLLRGAGITDYRAELIARTETGRAANIGSMVGATSTGLVTVKEWIAAKDNRTRRIPRDQFDHLNMDGTKIPMDATFKLQNKKGGFDLMLHPCDSSGSAGDVCNCRCTLGYEAQRDKNGKLLKLQDNPPKGNVGMIWGILTNAVGMQIGRLIADLFE
ncbi:MAG: Cellulophaga phage phi18:1 [Bacteroidota bacterium]